jgi:hypothetical protein
MSYQEQQALVAIITNLMTSALYFFYRFQSIDWNAPFDWKFWASVILWYLLTLIVVRIIIYIIFAILHAIITRKEQPNISDEMDRLIDMRATVYFYHVFTLGIFLSIGSLLLDFPPFAMFIGFMLSMCIAGLVLEFASIYFYRKGI